MQSVAAADKVLPFHCVVVLFWSAGLSANIRRISVTLTCVIKSENTDCTFVTFHLNCDFKITQDVTLLQMYL